LCRLDLDGAISEAAHREVGAFHLVGGENADDGEDLGE
jgi:hypothetical protein